ncbi:MAG: hypothetical protein HYS02_01815, partial [Candidatus Staskawiczbacteria bacterium]|nr:hypothetical protein [Candidatus Staskawiczbacteria bacterium]
MKIINKLIITSTLVSMVVLASMAITANAEVETRIFSDEGKDVIRFLDAYQPDIYNFINGDAIDDDSSTTLKVCQLAGFQRVQSVYSRNYATPYNNTISYWNGSSFAKDSAGNRGNTYIDTLVCADKVANEGNNLGCNDGIDNDFDGNIDFPADSGCSSGDDPDERETSVIASCPAGMTPVSVRQVSLDAKSSLTAGLTARNGFHVAGGTYLLKIINGAISYWNTDSIDTTLSGGGPNRAWLSQANVVYKKNGSFVE